MSEKGGVRGVVERVILRVVSIINGRVPKGLIYYPSDSSIIVTKLRTRYRTYIL